MKTITNLSHSRLCLLLLLLSFQGAMMAQEKLLFSSTTSSSSLLEDNCSAGDLNVTELYLGDINGSTITAGCEPGTDQTAYIYAVFNEVTNADRYSLRISYDLLVNDQFVKSVDDCLFNQTRIPVENDLNVQSINYKCGDRIELRNFYIRWHASGTKTCNNAYSPSKCFFSAPGFTVNAPLVANFEYYNPCNIYNVVFTDKTTGGEVGEFNPTTEVEEKLPYAIHEWSFGDGATQTLLNKFDGSTSHTYPGPGIYNVTLKVTDRDGEVDSQTYEIQVYAQLTGLILSKTSVECETSSTATITASGVTGGTGIYTYSINPEPAGLEQNNNEFSNLSAGTYTVTVTDSRNCSTSLTVTVTADDTTAPTISAPSNKAIEGCTTVDINNGGQTNLAYSSSATTISTAQFTNEGGSYTEVNVDTITYQDTSTGTCPLVVTRTFIITDICGKSASSTQTITINDTTNPDFNVPADITVSCEDSLDPTNTGDVTNESDNCSSDLEATYSDSVAPGSCANNSVITRTWTVQDDCGNTTSKTQEITVTDDEGPTFDAPANIEVSCEVDNTDRNITGKISNAVDNCSAKVYESFEDVITEGDCAGNYIITRTFTLKDDCSNATTKNQIITVKDNVAPNFDLPSNITVSCDQDITDLSVTGNLTNVTDNCSAIASQDFTDAVASGDCEGNYIITRTFTVKDECGNSKSKDQTITVQDNEGPDFDIPANVNISCDQDSTDLSITGNISNLTDNCSAIASQSYSDVTTAGSCEGTYTITRTFKVSDTCGNETNKTQTISVSDTTKPEITIAAENRIFECDGSGNSGAIEQWLENNGGASAADNCDSSLTWTNNYGSSTTGCEDAIEVIFRATDDCGNFVETTATYQITDTQAPTITVEANDKTVECDGSGNTVDLESFLSSNGGAMATDDCSAIAWTNNFTALSDDCGRTGSFTVTFTATDGCNNIATTTATFTIEDTTDPSFSVPGDITISCEQDASDLSITGSVSDGSDHCSTNVNVEYVDTVIAGDCTGNYVIERTFTATDECGNTSSQKQTITVEDLVPPTFNVPSDITIECDQDSSDLTVTGNISNEADNCSASIAATYTDTVAPGSCPGESVITRTFKATDECGNEATAIQIITIEDTTGPIIETPASSIILECSSSENSGGLQTWLTTNGGATASDNCSGNITWTNNYGGGASDCANAIEVIFTATDECGNSTTTTATYAVQDVNPPIIEGDTEDFTVECDGSGNSSDINAFLTSNGGATATDDCSAVSWENNFTGLSDLCGQTGAAEVTFTATDGCGNSATFTRTFKIVDTTPPTLTAASSISIECGETSMAQMEAWLANNGGATASDTCSDVQWSMETNGMSSMCANTGSITAIFTATDACGNTDSTTATFEIVDTTAPQFTVPAAVSIECNGNPTDLSVTGDVTDERDNCSTGLEATYTDETAEGECPGSIKITRTWTLTDACGNTNTQDQIISIIDTTAPLFTVPSAVSLECDEDLNDLTLTGDVADEADNCSEGLEATFTDETVDGECPGSQIITRTWTLIDACGNTNTQTQTINLTDTTAPTFTAPTSISISCEDDANDVAITGDVTDESDNCSTGLEATFTDSITAGDCPGSYSILRTWTLIDECNNTNTQTQNITVTDTTAPILDGELEETISVSCADIPAVPSLVFVDACTENVDVQFNEETSDVVDNTYVITREWSVTDECNNTATFTQTINVDISPSLVEAADFQQCINDTTIDLFDQIDSSIPNDGVFEITSSTGTSGSLNGSLLDPRTFGMGDYEITYSVNSDGVCPTDYIIKLNINKDCVVLPPPTPPVCVPEISQAVTPNGDNINDFFTVDVDPSCGFTVELIIFNRWGAKIYENNNYQGNWGAEASDASIGSANLVPTGTYYYIINLKNSDYPPFSGPIYVGTK